MKMNRRTFLLLAGGTGVVAAAGGLGIRLAGAHGFLVGANALDFACIDLGSGAVRNVHTPVVAHSFSPWPYQPGCVLGVEKSGSAAALVSFAEEKLLRTIEAPENRFFYGHMALSPDGTRYYSSQVDTKTGYGYIAVYDSLELEQIDDIPAAPGGNHDLSFTADGRQIAFTSSGVRHLYEVRNKPPSGGIRVEKAAVNFLDVAEKKIVRRLFLDDPSMVAGHLKPLPDGRVAMITTPFRDYGGPSPTRKGSLYVAEPGGELREWPVPDSIRAEMDDELLSLELEPRDRRWLAITNPKGKKILIFDVEKGSFEHEIGVHSQGLVWENGRLQIVALEPGEAVSSSGIPVKDWSSVKKLDSSHFWFAPPGFLS